VTRACALACRHCRAAAIDERHPGELTRKEGKQLLDDTARMGTPLVVFSGGDPLQRDDLEDLIAHAAHLGLRTGAIPAATDRLTQTRVQQLKDAGLNQMALSLDGFCAGAHDDFRRVEGSFTKTMSAAAWARAADLPLQINTVLGAWNARSFGSIALLVEHVLRPVMWEVFFLVPTGRGSELTGCTPEVFEHLFAEIFELSKRVRFMIKVTEGPHYCTSLIVTSNLPFESWTEILGSQRLTGALLDRLTHRIHILEANGESYRLRESKKRTKRNQPKKKEGQE
jgi:MoaA/NifB/PqqE/SkfB family radical SAM enzyme